MADRGPQIQQQIHLRGSWRWYYRSYGIKNDNKRAFDCTIVHSRETKQFNRVRPKLDRSTNALPPRQQSIWLDYLAVRHCIARQVLPTWELRSLWVPWGSDLQAPHQFRWWSLGIHHSKGLSHHRKHQLMLQVTQHATDRYGDDLEAQDASTTAYALGLYK